MYRRDIIIFFILEERVERLIYSNRYLRSNRVLNKIFAFIGSLVKMVRVIVVSTLKSNSGEERGAWQSFCEGRLNTDSSPEGIIPSRDTYGTSIMEPAIGYNRTIYFRRIVTHRIAVGSVSHRTPEARKQPFRIPTSAHHYRSWQQSMNIQPTSPACLPMDNSCLLIGITPTSRFSNLFPVFNRCYRRLFFMNYSGFTDRMYFSDITRITQKNRLVRSADGNR